MNPLCPVFIPRKPVLNHGIDRALNPRSPVFTPGTPVLDHGINLAAPETIAIASELHRVPTIDEMPILVMDKISHFLTMEDLLGMESVYESWHQSVVVALQRETEFSRARYSFRKNYLGKLEIEVAVLLQLMRRMCRKESGTKLRIIDLTDMWFGDGPHWKYDDYLELFKAIGALCPNLESFNVGNASGSSQLPQTILHSFITGCKNLRSFTSHCELLEFDDILLVVSECTTLTNLVLTRARTQLDHDLTNKLNLLGLTSFFANSVMEIGDALNEMCPI